MHAPLQCGVWCAVLCCCCRVWAKSDCNCKSARQKLKDQQTDKNGGRQVLLQLLLVLLVLQFVAICCCCCCCHCGCCGPSVRCCSCQCLPPSQSRVEQIKHKIQLWASAKLFNITLSGIIIIHCAAALWGRHTHRYTLSLWGDSRGKVDTVLCCGNYEKSLAIWFINL